MLVDASGCIAILLPLRYHRIPGQGGRTRTLRAAKFRSRVRGPLEVVGPTNTSGTLLVYGYVTAEIVAMAQARQEPAPATEAGSKVLDLFDRHHRRLYVLARRLTATPDDARDLVQDTFVRVARTARSAPADSSAAEAWLVRILINVCRDQWRVRATRRRLEAQFLSTSGWTMASGDSETALIAQTTVWRALEQLPPRRRAAIVLHELEGVAIAEIARLLGVLPVTVRWQLSRGRRELVRLITSPRDKDDERHSIDASRS